MVNVVGGCRGWIMSIVEDAFSRWDSTVQLMGKLFGGRGIFLPMKGQVKGVEIGMGIESGCPGLSVAEVVGQELAIRRLLESAALLLGLPLPVHALVDELAKRTAVAVATGAAVRPMARQG